MKGRSHLLVSKPQNKLTKIKAMQAPATHMIVAGAALAAPGGCRLVLGC